MEDVTEITMKMVQDILSIKDIEMRTFVLAERLKEYKAEEIAEILKVLCQKAIDKDEKCKEVLLSFVNFNIIIKEWGNAKLGKIYMTAQERNYQPVVRLLSRPSFPEGLKELDSEHLSDSLFDEVPLGARRSLAKGVDKNLLSRLLNDPNPLVIRNLLKNPRITEREVLKIASKRPNSPQVLEEISLSKKWIVRYSIKIALARNPYTPPAISIKLLHFFMEQDLKEICEDTFLHSQICETAESLLKKRIKEKNKNNI